MSSDCLVWMIIGLLCAGAVCQAVGDETAPCPRAVATLEAGGPLRVIGFGDSITGVYYHTGGLRAWPAMLGIALQRLYPQAQVETINAGVSGNTTAAGLARIERDVLSRKPDLVVVMFGMNDMTGTPAETFRANLRTIVSKCREVGAEVVLCTPNSIYPGNSRRPVAVLEEFAQVVRDVAAGMDTPLADCYEAYEQLHRRSPRAWRLCMSEVVHPGMTGHKLIAEVAAEAITGRSVSVQDVGPIMPAIPHTLELLARGKPVKIIAMPPADALVETVLRSRHPDAQLEMMPWPVEGRTLAQIEKWSKAVRGMEPDLVVIAVPPDATAADEEAFIRSYSWVLNWSLSFGRREWDVVALMPSVFGAPTGQQLGDVLVTDLTRDVVRGQDIPWLERAPGDARPALELLDEWLLPEK